jgi:hypothetical protein
MKASWAGACSLRFGSVTKPSQGSASGHFQTNRRLHRRPSIDPILPYELTFSFILNNALGPQEAQKNHTFFI